MVRIYVLPRWATGLATHMDDGLIIIAGASVPMEKHWMVKASVGIDRSRKNQPIRDLAIDSNMLKSVILDENGSIDIFADFSEAERYIEAIDVKNQEYDGYDSDGLRLELVVETDSEGLERVVIRYPRVPIDQSEALSRLLAKFLKGHGYLPSDLEVLNLADLVRESLRFRSL